MIVASRLEVTGWTENLGRVNLLVMIAFILGALLGRSRFSGVWVGVFAAAYSVFFVTWQMGLTMEGGILWGERLASLGGRLGQTTRIFLSNQPVSDPVLFLLSMYLLFWGVSLIAGLQMVREGRPWLPLVVAVVMFFIFDYYHPFAEHRDRYSAFLTLAVVVLVGRIFFLRSRAEWGSQGVAMDLDTGQSLTWSVVVVAALLVLVSWNLPMVFETMTPGTAARERFSQAWMGFRERFSNAFAGLQTPVSVVNEYFGDKLELGTGAILGDEEVFLVETSMPELKNARYYWRGHSYNYYDGVSWQNTIAAKELLLARDWPLTHPIHRGRVVVDLTYTLESETARTLYVPNFPVSVSRAVRVTGDVLEDSETDAVALVSDTVLRRGEVLRARAEVSHPTTNELRAAGTDYPEWLRTRYLQLPQNFSSKVAELAEEITRGAETPYDQVQAVTRYLRKEIRYQAVIPPPPAGVDPMEWFLFEKKEGFCNYYATAEVLMLRSLGIPARLGAGFAQGTYDEDAEVYRVQRMDAHAWPEVYFPGIGWVEFEPTVSQPESSFFEESGARPAQPSVPAAAAEDREREDPDFDRLDRLMEERDAEEAANAGRVEVRAWVAVWIATLLLVLAGLVWRWLNLGGRLKPFPEWVVGRLTQRGVRVPWVLNYWAALRRMSRMEKIYSVVPFSLKLLRSGNPSLLTPAEQVRELVKWVPQAETAGAVLLEEAQKAIFSRSAYDLERARKARREIWLKVIPVWLRYQLRRIPREG